MTSAAPATTRERRTLVALLAVYLVLLTWVIVWKLAVPWVGGAAGLPHPVKLVPFVAFGDADASAPLEVVANVLLFVPFGIFVGLLAPRLGGWRAAGVFAAASLVFEITQYVIAVGSADVTDVIANVAGGFAGLGLLALARRRLRERTRPVATRVLVIGTVVAVVAVAAFVASPLRYAPQPDVVVPGMRE